MKVRVHLSRLLLSSHQVDLEDRTQAIRIGVSILWAVLLASQNYFELLCSSHRGSWSSCKLRNFSIFKEFKGIINYVKNYVSFIFILVLVNVCIQLMISQREWKCASYNSENLLFYYSSPSGVSMSLRYSSKFHVKGTSFPSLSISNDVPKFCASLMPCHITKQWLAPLIFNVILY